MVTDFRDWQNFKTYNADFLKLWSGFLLEYNELQKWLELEWKVEKQIERSSTENVTIKTSSKGLEKSFIALVQIYNVESGTSTKSASLTF